MAENAMPALPDTRKEEEEPRLFLEQFRRIFLRQEREPKALQAKEEEEATKVDQPLAGAVKYNYGGVQSGAGSVGSGTLISSVPTVCMFILA
ncbi:unnamed protein product, partial [Polarella glacialis]